ncbi:MAG: hypothetical protein II664_08695, partial [Oscillospiraceae bacterium]|nr:hypothetical protein [Oscillospiraceae bacterium]
MFVNNAICQRGLPAAVLTEQLLYLNNATRQRGLPAAICQRGLSAAICQRGLPHSGGHTDDEK